MNNLVFANSQNNIKLVRGIYFLFDGSNLVYIGQSENIFKRVPIHSLKAECYILRIKKGLKNEY